MSEIGTFRFRHFKICPIPKQSRFQTLFSVWNRDYKASKWEVPTVWNRDTKMSQFQHFLKSGCLDFDAVLSSIKMYTINWSRLVKTVRHPDKSEFHTLTVFSFPFSLVFECVNQQKIQIFTEPNNFNGGANTFGKLSVASTAELWQEGGWCMLWSQLFYRHKFAFYALGAPGKIMLIT